MAEPRPRGRLRDPNALKAGRVTLNLGPALKAAVEAAGQDRVRAILRAALLDGG